MGLEVGLDKYPMDWNLPSQGGYMASENTTPEVKVKHPELTCVVSQEIKLDEMNYIRRIYLIFF